MAPLLELTSGTETMNGFLPAIKDMELWNEKRPFGRRKYVQKEIGDTLSANLSIFDCLKSKNKLL